MNYVSLRLSSTIKISQLGRKYIQIYNVSGRNLQLVRLIFLLGKYINEYLNAVLHFLVNPYR